MKKRLSILGSTGSIGVNALDVVFHLKDKFEICYLSANSNINLLMKQVIKFKPKAVAVVDKVGAQSVKGQLDSMGIELLEGRNGLLDLSQRDDIDIMLNALVGSYGMEPTLNAIRGGVNVALANKESLVMAGDLINKFLEHSKAKLFPVDSEHSAIWQCLIGEDVKEVNRIILTGSGGPFRLRELSTFKNIKVEEALNHPNWDMGKKISVDSATMMNKGLEVIEAFWLFGFNHKKIDIVVHPQSIIHSMIEMNDGSIKAQMGIPDMKVPIQYALTYPNHMAAPWERLDFFQCGDLTFEKPDFQRFPSILHAFKSLERGGTSGAALNLSNDMTVDLFLKNKIQFTDIIRINEVILDAHPWIAHPSLEDLNELDTWIKNKILEL
ncbi:MAG: 1-deoxy-D-xylulose-5-phosphate reductoisomerase [Candidatus Neomarinimicrobiota bacterium]